MSISIVTLFHNFNSINTRVKHGMAHTEAHAKSCHSSAPTAVLFLWGQGSALRRDEQGIMSSTLNMLSARCRLSAGSFWDNRAGKIKKGFKKEKGMNDGVKKRRWGPGVHFRWCLKDGIEMGDGHLI